MSVITEPPPLTPNEIVLVEDKIRRIQKWVLQTQFHEPPANPFTPATPPITLSASLPSPLSPPRPPPNAERTSITAYRPLFMNTNMNMTNAPGTHPGPMIPPVVLTLDPRTGTYDTNIHSSHPMTTDSPYVQPNTTMTNIPSTFPGPGPVPLPISDPISAPPIQPQANALNPPSANITAMPASASSHRVPVVPSQTRPQYQTIPAFIPPRSRTHSRGRPRSRSRDRHHHHHHGHHHSSRRPRSSHGHRDTRARSYSPIARAGVVSDKDDDVNPPIPRDYVPASPGPEHKSHRTRIGAGLAAIGGRTARGSAALGHRHGHGHQGQIYSHDYAKNLPSAFRRMSIGGGGTGAASRPTFIRHRSRSIDDRDLQTSRARYRNDYPNANMNPVTGGIHQYPQHQSIPYQVQYPQPQYLPQQGAAGVPTMIYPSVNQPTVVPMPTHNGRGGGRWMIFPPTSPNQPFQQPSPPAPIPVPQPRSAVATASPSFFSRLFGGFGRKHGHTSVQPPAAHPHNQHIHHYTPHRNHHNQKLTKGKRRRDSY